jgi:hypothetical protein
LFPVPPHDQHPDPASPPSKRRRQSPSTSRPATASTASASVSASVSPTPTPSIASTSPQTYNYAHPTSTSSPPTYTLPPPQPPQHSTGISSPYGFSSPQPTSSTPYPATPPAQSPPGGITLPPISHLSNSPTSTYQGSSLQLPPMQAPSFTRAGLTLPPLPRGPPPPHHLSYSYPPPPPPPAQPPTLHPPPQTSVGTGEDIKATPAGPSAPEGIVAYLGEFAIKEDTKQTDSLSGACFAQSQSLEYHGRKVLMFVFSVRVLLLLYHHPPSFLPFCS